MVFEEFCPGTARTGPVSVLEHGLELPSKEAAALNAARAEGGQSGRAHGIRGKSESLHSAPALRVSAPDGARW
jgi:hypothetical protein